MSFLILTLRLRQSIVETAHLAFLYTYIYRATINHYGDILSALEDVWSIGFSVTLAMIVTSLVQVSRISRYAYILRWGLLSPILYSCSSHIDYVACPKACGCHFAHASVSWGVWGLVSLSAFWHTSLETWL